MELNEFQRRAKLSRKFRLQSDITYPASLSAEEAQALGTAQAKELSRLFLSNGLAAQMGEIANRLKKRLRDGADYDAGLRPEILQQIGHALWYLAVLADEFGADLDPIAVENLRFNQNRWYSPDDENSPQPRDFDSGYPAVQRLPTQLTARFSTREVDGLKKTRVFIYPKYPVLRPYRTFGAEIDDNSAIDDHYRFHDVYHLAYMAFLGWSPVVRALLKCKRKQNLHIDRTEDGARARDTEEATTAFIYSYVSAQDFLTTSDNVDTGLLTQVCKLVRALEVKECFAKEWEEAILKATIVLRELVRNDGGWVRVDRTSRELVYLGVAKPGSR